MRKEGEYWHLDRRTLSPVAGDCERGSAWLVILGAELIVRVLLNRQVRRFDPFAVAEDHRSFGTVSLVLAKTAREGPPYSVRLASAEGASFWTKLT
jgi:hypothetical protein